MPSADGAAVTCPEPDTFSDLARSLRDSLAAERARIIAVFQAGAPVTRLLLGLSQLTDRHVRTAAERTAG